jgi:hypothetical protein
MEVSIGSEIGEKLKGWQYRLYTIDQKVLFLTN